MPPGLVHQSLELSSKPGDGRSWARARLPTTWCGSFSKEAGDTFTARWYNVTCRGCLAAGMEEYKYQRKTSPRTSVEKRLEELDSAVG